MYSTPSARPQRRPCILVVDDEARLQRVLAMCLERDGFQVLQAAGAQEAIEVYARQHHDIDIVLMDVNLPDIDGPGTLSVLRELNPDVLCCFTTGDSSRFRDEGLLDKGVFLLQKPFVAAEVSRILCHLLDRRAIQKSTARC